MQQSFSDGKRVMHDDWVPFEGRPFGRKSYDKLRVTLNKRNMFYLNPQAHEALGQPEAVEFLFNEELEAIGMRPAHPQLESAFRVTERKAGSWHGYVIQAAAFLQHYKLKVDGTRQFNKITIDRHGLMTLPLASVTRVRRGAR